MSGKESTKVVSIGEGDELLVKTKELALSKEDGSKSHLEPVILKVQRKNE